MRSLYFALFALLACSTACGVLSPMQPNVVNGGRAVSVTRHPSNNNEFFVASESGGLFKSTNAGVKWTHVSGNNTFWFSDVKYCVADPGIIIATALNDSKVANGGGIYRSTNNGNSWSQVSLTTPVLSCQGTLSAYCIAVEPGNNKIWAGTSCGLAVSMDNGASFIFLPPSANYNNDAVYAVLAPQENQIKILTDAGVKVSTNDGTSWSFSATGLPYVDKGQHSQIACSPLNHNHIFWASNFSPYDGKWHNGIYYSADNGSTWTNLIDNLGINRRPTCYTAKALSGDGNKFDLYFSDGGCTLRRASFTNTTPPVISGGWTDLVHPHCDFADLSFKTDGKTPAILAGDGGLFTSGDNGAHWSFTGGGDNGYNALQITEVLGQLHSGDNKSDLYYATQDNDIRSSPDNGATWPNANQFCCEGFFLNIPRQSLAADETKFTGVDCGACFNFMTGPLLSGGVNTFPNVANATSNPRLLKPGAYIQSDTLPGAPTVSLFSLTTNNGGAWTMKYGFTNPQRDFSKIAGDASNPVVFTAVQNPGTTSDGQEIVGIKKIVDVLSAGSPIVSDVTGYGSLGIFPTMFAWYKPYGVDHFDPNHIIAPDIISDMVKVSTDGGATWKNDSVLTNLVTQSGVFKFRWGPFTQISNIAFDPEVRGRILVGTVQAGIFSTCNGGKNWEKLSATESLPNVSSFYFMGDNDVVVSSYGRGLWKLSLPDCPNNFIPKKPYYQLEEPLIWWKGAYVPLSQIGDPEVCPVCGFFIITDGEIREVNVLQDRNEMKSLGITSGKISGFDYQGRAIAQVPFQVMTSTLSFNPGEDVPLQELMRKGFKVKGVYMEGSMLKGLILSMKDIQVSQLPRKQAVKNFLEAELIKDQRTGMVTGVKLRGKGFNGGTPLMITIDGKRIDVGNAGPTFDKDGIMVLNLPFLFTPGGHTIMVEQKNSDGSVRQATTVVIPLNDINEKRN